MEKFPLRPILIIDDEPNICLSVTVTLASVGITNVIICKNARSGMQELTRNQPAVILLDLNLPDKSGCDLLLEVKENSPDTIVMVISGQNEIATAVECMKKGAFDYLMKPVDRDRLITSVRRAVEMDELKQENSMMRQVFLESSTFARRNFSEIITGNSQMISLFRYCEAIAHSRQAVLITGETGSGKELFARAIHKLSKREGKFVAVNLAGVDSNMFSDTLFGHIKGAYTGADKVRKGFVEESANGTLFLDEIGDLSLEIQVKLLRLLQEKEYMQLGTDTPKITNTRVVVATHKPLEELVAEEIFRKDLFYRLKTHHIHIPPLRERLDDIVLLFDHFLNEAAQELDKSVPTYPQELITFLKTYSFPGNVRELRSMVFDALSRHKSMILSTKTFHQRVEAETASATHDNNRDTSPSKVAFPQQLPTLKEMAQTLTTEAMNRADNNQSIAAKLLGISQQALSKRLKNLKDGK